MKTAVFRAEKFLYPKGKKCAILFVIVSSPENRGEVPVGKF
jgi:hypothetical protein